MPKQWLPCKFRERHIDKYVCTRISKTGALMTVSVGDCWDCQFRAYTPPGTRAAEHYQAEQETIPFSPQECAWLDALGIPRRRRD